MTLYEQFKAGEIDFIEYHLTAEKVLMDAINETLKENMGYTYYYFENELKDTCDIKLITETNGARKSVEEALKCFRGKIDRDNLNMVLLSSVMEEENFKTLYSVLHTPIENPSHKRFLNTETANTICSIVTASSAILKCQSVVGTLRSNNEDFAVTIVSPINDKIKLLLICDGIGGYDGGELASKFVAKGIIKWFNQYNFENKDFKDVEKELKNVVMNIHHELQKIFVDAGTTLTSAIVGEEETIIANIGDSRTYAIIDERLEQLTADDSMVWRMYYADDEGLEKDELRFCNGNNCIEDCIGFVGTGKIKTSRIENQAYDGLLLTSDGVTDVLSDKTMLTIFKETYNEDYVDKLLHESCYGKTETIGFDDDIAFHPTYPGSDNATAAMYLKLIR